MDSSTLDLEELLGPLDEAQDIFNSLVAETEKYFNFVHKLITENLIFDELRIDKDLIDIEITHILKANSYLILYNMIEATIENSLKAVHSVICTQSFNNLTEILKSSILTEFRKMEINLDKFRYDCVLDMILHKTTLETYKPFSGNLDGRKIRSILDKYGIVYNTTHSDNSGDKLYIIKNRRNTLAHGGSSFIDVGRLSSIDELCELKKQTICFLENFLNCIRLYITNSHYCVVSDAQ